MRLSRTTHAVILLLALLGVAMSGYLTYNNYWGQACGITKPGWLNCGTGTKILGQPTCVYGLAMFTASAALILAVWRRTEPTRTHRALFWVALVGVLFSGGLSFYEIVIKKFPGIPACVYGLILYAGILTLITLGLRGKPLTTPPVSPILPPTA